MNKYL